MSIIDQLSNKIETMSNEFQFLIRENKQLKAQLENLKDKNDILTRNNQDMILSIKSKLNKEDKV